MVPRFTTASALLVVFAGGTMAADPVESEKIRASIKAGQNYLRAVYRPGGPGAGGLGPGGLIPQGPIMAVVGGNVVGSYALAGLALLESGVPSRDESVIHITRTCREMALSSTSTYEISLLIMYLDRLGVRSDRPVIQFLTYRLLSGQCQDGSWSYSCVGMALDPVQTRVLRATLLEESRLTTPDGAKPSEKKEKPRPREDLDDVPKPKKDSPKETPKDSPEEPKEDGKPKVHPVIARIVTQGGSAPAYTMGTGDHSNTQFATVGLWCGRRHGVNVSEALAAIDKHYRSVQSPDGGWAYSTAGALTASSPSMTCAGLMGLALGFGAKNLKEGSERDPKLEDPETLNKDKQVTDALKYVGSIIEAAANAQPVPVGVEGQSKDLTDDLYFMWSLERVGMVYGLKTIGKVDWYDWGSTVLMRKQQRDGSWRSDGLHSGSVDNATAFALLFLCRADLTSDLSNNLKGRVKDPGASRLVGGGDIGKIVDEARKASASNRKGDGETTKPQPRTDTGPSAVAAANTTVDKLAAALMAAGPGEREVKIAEYRDTKGSEYTDALSQVAAKATGEKQSLAREALVERLKRMTANTLIDCMGYTDRELRRAAALAAGSKKGTDRLVPLCKALIGRVGDHDAFVAQAARTSLKALADQDFGPEEGASAADRTKAVLAWQKWLESQK
jgi:hypothetical protein